MRHVSRVELQGQHLNVVPMPPRAKSGSETQELSAFRGFLLAASASVMLWGVLLATLWLMIWKK
jgi:hypothetical protein